MPIPSQIVIQEHPITALIDSTLESIVKIAEAKIAGDTLDKTRLAGLLERETVRKQSEIDDINEKIESEIKELQTMSGVLYALPKDQQTQKAFTVQRDISLPIIEGFKKFSKDLEDEQVRLNEQLNLILREVGDAKLVQNWFAGVGHTPLGGIDKFLWDIGDYTPAELDEYLNEYAPHIKSVAGRSAFLKGAISKGRNLLPLTMIGLNEMLNKARTAELNQKISNLNYTRTSSSASTIDLQAKQEARDENIYNIITPFAIASGNTGLNRGIASAMALAPFSEEDDEYEDALKVRQKEFEVVGAFVSNEFEGTKTLSKEKLQELNIELGEEIITSNMRFTASAVDEVNINRTDFTGWTRALEKIYHHAIHNETRLGFEELKGYKRRISDIVGMRYDFFMKEFYPSLEKGLEDRDKDALSQTSGALNTAVSGTGYSSFDEEFRDLYRTALTSKTVSGEEEFINTNMGELWKLAKDKYGFTQEQFRIYIKENWDED